MKIIDAWTLLYFIHSLEPVLGHTVNNSNNNNFLCDWLLTMEVNFTHEFRNVRTWGEISTNSNLKYKSPPPGHLNEWDREEAEVVDSFDWSWFGWTLDISTDMRFSLSKTSILFFVRASDASGENFEYDIVNCVLWKSFNSI